MTHKESYFAKLRQLVLQEQHFEQTAYRQALEQMGILFSGGIREPACRYPISLGGCAFSPLGRPTLELRFEVGEEESDLDFEPSKPVVFFSVKEGVASELPVSAVVESVVAGLLVVSFSSIQARQLLVDRSVYHPLGVQIGVDNTSFRVMLDSIDQAMRCDRKRFVQLRDVLLGNAPSHFHPRSAVSLPWLNHSQQEAVRNTLASIEVSVIHGPPGTGKTTTLVETVMETLQRENQVLVCAPSNAAVDWISLQLLRRGVPVLRVGNPVRMCDEMLQCSYEHRYSAHPDYGELWSIRRLLNEGVKGRQTQSLHRRMTELEIRIDEDLFRESRVVSCTLIGSAYAVLQHRHFTTLFIDEAAQALEPACWTAMLKADRVVMGGDHQQLPPTVKSIEAAHDGLSDTLMQKVIRHHPECVTLLTTQYRMNETIMTFSSRWFYHGKLRAAPEVAHRLVSPLDTPIAWIDTSTLDVVAAEHRTQSGSITNALEAKIVIRTLREYIDTVGLQRVLSDGVDFGVITPYRGQARLLRKLLRWQYFFRQLRSAVTVGTVDGFQGQERDVIILSLVRANDSGNIGFLRDLRRMNVAITRARMKLIVIGNAQTLTQHRFYHSLIAYIRTHGDFLQVEA